MTNLEIAKKYLAKSFAVMPLAPNGKKPILDGWTTNLFPEENDLAKWFSGDNNIGIRCGEISNLIVIDVDLKNLIAEKKAQLWEEITGLPDTYKVKTANGGWHYYYKYNGFPSKKGIIHALIKTTSGQIPTIDIQSDRTQIVAPPSVVKQDIRVGNQNIEYKWDKTNAEIKDFPEDLFLIPPPKRFYTDARNSNDDPELVKERIPIVALAKQLGIELDRHNKTHCLWHNETDGSLSFRNQIKGFKCFGCEKTGDIFTLYQFVKNTDFPTALKELKEIAGLSNVITKTNTSIPAPGEALKLSELLEAEMGEIEWLAKPLISANSITILSGAPGQYKTFLALHLAISFAEGNTKAFGNFEVQKAQPVMIIDEENNKRRLQARFKHLGANKQSPIFLHILENIKLNETTAKKLLVEMQEKNIKIAIFDSLVRFFDFDENSSQEINRAYSILKIFLNAGISLIFTHHHRKQGPFKIKSSDVAAVSEAIRGSTDILAMCDNHLAILPVERGEIVIIQTKQREAETVLPFKIEIIENEERILTFAYSGEFNEEESKKEKAKEAVLNIIKTKKGVLREELETQLRGIISTGYLTLAIKELADLSIIEGKTKKELGMNCQGAECRKKIFSLTTLRSNMF